ncbi:NAD-dependent epimerase/dehydratase family protein [Parachryseolinea silvisoli]|uniref:NAD-dependent epimerase/dehydratase family protein n=1 Tax=Parachryseolinea silvisoli TaxID=2873601 RepID=UPI002265CCF1|nr:NAD-dependent epimerase/dehydratase family protein [Parachryseolinea silvisoli]MCD9017909.1 NAD-dependent epimerase/dehydratase family protein [Parachryseolinea silvisoli]
MKSVFVTGGSGFVGRNLIKKLTSENIEVFGLSRSPESDQRIIEAGATPIRGDIHNADVLRTALAGIDTVFHLAAAVDFWKSRKQLWHDHVGGTKVLLEAATKNNVPNFVYLGAASVIMNGKPILNGDERTQSDNLIDGYSRTKLEAEQMILKANSPTLRTIAVRPPLIWGKGDTSALPQIKAASEKGNLSFINGGTHLIVTCHVQNVCHALTLAAKSKIGGEAFFVTDGEKLQFRQFITDILKTQNMEAPNKTVSLGMARTMANIFAFIWTTFGFKSTPPLYPGMVNTLGLPFIVSDDKAKKLLGYHPIISVKEGLVEMLHNELV